MQTHLQLPPKHSRPERDLARTIEIATVLCLSLLLVVARSNFGFSVAAATMVCLSYVSAAFQTKVPSKDWRRFLRFGIWVVRLIAIVAGVMLFHSAPSQTVSYTAVVLFACCYTASELFLWRRVPSLRNAE